MEPVSSYTIQAKRSTYKTLTNILSLYHSSASLKNENGIDMTLTGEICSRHLIDFPIQLRKLTSGRGIMSTEFSHYTPSSTQSEERSFFGIDPRNEVPFVIKYMGASLDDLDVPLAKKQVSGAKFKWKKDQRKER